MPDIALRFNKDMLVLSAPLEAALARQGVDVARDLEMITLLEGESLEDVLRMEVIAGAQCVVAATAGVTRARLAHANLQDRGEEIARAALEAAQAVKAQHVLVEIGPCGLPLDATSKASLNENRAQYAAAARLFADAEFDAFFLNGFATCDDLKCALMGVRQVSDVPVLASVDVGADGVLASGRGTVEDACAVMVDYEAAVVGFATAADADAAAAVAARMAASCELPVLAQLVVREKNVKQGAATPGNPYFCADVMVDAAVKLRAAGAQFLRAAGNATPAYTGALAVAVMGFDVVNAGSAAFAAGGVEGDVALSAASVLDAEGAAGSVGAEEGAGEEAGDGAAARTQMQAQAQTRAQVQEGLSAVTPSLAFDSPEMADLVAAVRAEIAAALKGDASAATEDAR